MMLNVWRAREYNDLLLRIVGGIGEDPWVDTTFDPVSTLDYDAILCSVDEGIIEKMLPNRMHQFSAAVGQDALLLCLPMFVSRHCPIMKCIG